MLKNPHRPGIRSARYSAIGGAQVNAGDTAFSTCREHGVCSTTKSMQSRPSSRSTNCCIRKISHFMGHPTKPKVILKDFGKKR